jgi:hypothetical protein
MALRGIDPESYITEYTLVYEDKFHTGNAQAAGLKEYVGFLGRSHIKTVLI